jgi:hypothetical protein
VPKGAHLVSPAKVRRANAASPNARRAKIKIKAPWAAARTRSCARLFGPMAFLGMDGAGAFVICQWVFDQFVSE